MPTTINASNTTGGAVVTGDGSGVLELQSGGVTGITVNGANVTVAGTLTATGGVSGGLTSPATVAGNSTAGAEIRLPEDTDNGSNYVALKAADNIASNVTFTLPAADGTNGQVLQTNGSGALSFVTPAGVGSSYTEFLASGTWTKPAGVTWVYVEVVGGGGGGRSSAFSGATSTGGGGGEFTSQLMLASTVGATVTVTVGTGGAGGTIGGSDGSPGGSSSFGSLASSRGGGGGIQNASVVPGIPGSSGTATVGAGLLFPQAGFAGSSNGVGGNTIYGGAGGGGSNGTAARAGGTSTYGGAGGASVATGSGLAGSVPGGGGGAGGDTTGSGGAGAAGRVRVWAW